MGRDGLLPYSRPARPQSPVLIWNCGVLGGQHALQVYQTPPSSEVRRVLPRPRVMLRCSASFKWRILRSGDASKIAHPPLHSTPRSTLPQNPDRDPHHHIPTRHTFKNPRRPILSPELDPCLSGLEVVFDSLSTSMDYNFCDTQGSSKLCRDVPREESIPSTGGHHGHRRQGAGSCGVQLQRG